MQILQNFFDVNTIEIITRLSAAILFGIVIGAERVWAGKTAGMRTYALVSMGAALFIIVSEMITSKYIGVSNFDPLRLASQIVVGIGFIGTGLIFTKDSKLTGLTTATSLWVVAGIGMACGFGLFKIAFLATFFTLFVFIVLWFLEEGFRNSKVLKHDKESEDKVQ